MIGPLDRGILLAVANEAHAGRLDERNQLIDSRLRRRIQRQRDRSREQGGENGSKKLAHQTNVAVSRDAPSGPSIGSPLRTRTLMRFQTVRLWADSPHNIE